MLNLSATKVRFPQKISKVDGVTILQGRVCIFNATLVDHLRAKGTTYDSHTLPFVARTRLFVSAKMQKKPSVR